MKRKAVTSVYDAKPFDGVPGVPDWAVKWADEIGSGEGSQIRSGQWMAERQWDNGPVTFWLNVGEVRPRKKAKP